MDLEKNQSDNNNSELNDPPRNSGLLGLGVVGSACCLGPLALAGVVTLPTLGIVGGIGLIITIISKNLKSIFARI